MEMITVISSNIDSIGYDAKKKKMRIVFSSGAEYDYDGVPKKIFDQMIVSGSVGSFFYKNIKGKFSYSLV